MRRVLWIIAVLLPLVFAPAVCGAVILGQVQTFSEADPHWVIAAGPALGSPVPVPTALGGPGGAADPYLSIVSTGGSGPGSRLSAQNFTEWAGNYTAAGVSEIRMDVNNFGSTDVFLRLLFLELGMMGPVNVALTTNPVIVPGGSGWQTIAFNVSPAALTATLGTAAGALSNASELRIFHNPAATFEPGLNPPVVANVGVDNITAAGVPEPSTWTMVLGGLLLAGVARRKLPRR